MKKREKMELFNVPFFPFRKSWSRRYLYRCIVGFGGNQRDTLNIFKKVIRRWQDDKRLRVIQTSSILKNPPFGYLEQPYFLNAIAKIETSLTPQEFLKVLLHEETRFKRVRSFKNAPRTLDLDVIMFDFLEMRTKKLILPHPKWKERVSVVVPLITTQIANSENSYEF